MADQVSRPVQILLGVTVLVALLWFVALRPKTAGTTGTTTPAPATPTAPGVKGLTDDVAKAKATAGQTTTTTPGTTAATPGTSTAAAPSATTGRGSAPAVPRPAPPTTAASHGPAWTAQALAHHRVLALLFYNPRASDDRAVLRSLRALRLPRTVSTVTVPMQRVAEYAAVTAKVAVTGSPTFVVFDRQGAPHQLVGYAAPELMRQRVTDALAAR